MPVQPDPAGQPQSERAAGPQSERAAGPQPAPARRPRLSRNAWLIVAAVVVVALLLVVVGAALNDRDRNHDADPPPGDPPPAERAVSGPLEGREQASFVLLDGVTSAVVRAVDLDDRLYHVETPEGGQHLPVVTVVGDEVRLELADSHENGTSTVEVQLHSAVRWQVRIMAGSTEQIIDLAQARVTGVELSGGATRIELTLPPPQGTTTVRMSGGVDQWIVHQVGDAPARVRVGGGAGSVTIDGNQQDGIAGGTVFTQPGWDGAEDRVDIDAVAGMATFVLDRR